MTSFIIGLSMVGVFVGILGIILLNTSRRKAAEAKALAALVATAPTTWVSTGLPPPEGWETALDVIRKAYDKLPAFGTIEWVTGPYRLPSGVLAMGDVVTFHPPHVRVSVTELVEQGALSHEMLHIDDAYRFGRRVASRESPGDKAFVAEFTAVNAAIAKALGR